MARSRSSAFVVAVRLDRPRERAVEPVARAEQARVDDVHDRPQLAEPVLDRRAGHRDPPPRAQPAQRTRALRRRVLDVLRLVEQQPVPVDERERLDVARRDVVGRDDDVGGCARPATSAVAGEPRGAVMREHAQRRREPLDLGAHCLTTLIGQTTSVGPSASAPNSSRSDASIAIACTVLPRPMSSARIAPTPRSPSMRSQPWPRSWNGKSSNCIAAGVGSERNRRSSSSSSDASGASSVTSPSSRPASSVSRPETARTRSTMPEPLRGGARGSAAPARRPSGGAHASLPATRMNGSFAAASSASSSSVSDDVADGEPPVELRQLRGREEAARADGAPAGSTR